ncbi:MAG: HPF/RaiA family ribosome-associated protein [Dechloromonas sp.]|nr:HPF/RaiA family ribosome-associated protein [Dechloromonas sp.]
MQIQIQAAHFDDQGTSRQSIEQRVRFALRRLQHQISQARIRLTDINGPRGGVDKECQLTLKQAGPGSVVIKTQGQTYANALDAALQRASQALLRSLQRRRNHPRQRPNHDQTTTEET